MQPVDCKTVDNLIIGSGMAALATAVALRDRGVSFEVVDVGFDLDPSRKQLADDLSRLSPDRWSRQSKELLFPPVEASIRGVDRRFLFGSDFPYQVPDLLSVNKIGCVAEFSHSLGGFGSVWGAAALPYSEQSLRKWPIEKDALYSSYRNVLNYMPLSAERDGLESSFPVLGKHLPPLEPTRQARALLRALDRRKGALKRMGIEYGRARVAVDSSAGSSGCRYCGMCLHGCVYGAIFSPRTWWEKLGLAGQTINRDQYVLEIVEHADLVEVICASTTDGSIRRWHCKRLFLGCGQFATTRILARSLKLFNKPIKILDSQYFFFPMISYKAQLDEQKYALADAFIEVLNNDISADYMHFQIYGTNDILRSALKKLWPFPLPLSPISNRFYIIQGYLNSEDSGHMEFELLKFGSNEDRVELRGVGNQSSLATARKAQALLRRAFLTFGFVPPFVKIVPLGRSFHAGGSFPMGGRSSIQSSDDLGRPAGLQRVHIVDSACFPSIPSSTIGFTIMANADRIARATPL